jgi:hypothetical protein
VTWAPRCVATVLTAILMGAAAAPAQAVDQAVFYRRAASLSPEPISELGALPARVLSRNRDTGRLALELTLAPRSRVPTAGALADRSVELVVVDGELRFGREQLKPRDFAYTPAGRARAALRTHGGARVLMFFDPAPADVAMRDKLRDIGSYVTRYSEGRWNPGSLSQLAGFDLKLEIQHLKKDPLSGARTWLVRLNPPLNMPFEVHSVAEEAWVLAGRFSQPECMPDGLRSGVYEAGDYFYRPAGIPHSGPGAGPLEPTTFLMRAPAALDVVFYSRCERAQPSARVTTDATTRREVAQRLDEWIALRNAGRWQEMTDFLADDPRFAWVEFGRVSMPTYAAAVAELTRASGRQAQTVTELSDVTVEPLGSELAMLRAAFLIRARSPEAAAAATAARPGGIDRSGVLTATLLFSRQRRWQFLQVNFSQARSAP